MGRDINEKRPKPPQPIRHGEYRRLPIYRIPPYEPLTPGLRRKELASAIGFHHVRSEED